MKLITYKNNNVLRIGVVTNEWTVIDLSDQFTSLLDLIEGGNESLTQVQEIIRSRKPSMKLADLELTAPIPEPKRDIFCVGWNYLKHFKEGVGKRGSNERQLPDYPTFFIKPTTTINSPYGNIPIDPAFSTQFDYEAELAIVIGKKGRSIPEEKAGDYLFGYTVANDISTRDIQQRHGGQWLKGKAMDGSCPMGPWIVTANEIPDPQNLSIQCFVNDEKRQDANTRQMIFPINRIISELSLAMTLLPGDIILTGTPDGVGAGRNPQVFLNPGDHIVTSISEIGKLRNFMEMQPLNQWDAQ